MNEKLIKLLSRIRDLAEIKGEPFKRNAYARAISNIEKLDWEISKRNLDLIEQIKIAGIGKGIKKKLLEYANTGTIRELTELEEDPTVRAWGELNQIAGVGPATIKKWILMDVRTISDLKKEVARGRIKLNKMQMEGLKHYKDLAKKIPRDEVFSISNKIFQIIKKVHPDSIFITAGSYRRGKSFSGDIDIITTGKKSFISELDAELRKQPEWISSLSMGNERLTFLWRGPSGVVRQIDILWLRRESFSAGVLYFTGSWEFNQAMRAHASKLGYRLNQRGLFKKGKLLAARSEREIFSALGLKYVSPEQRDKLSPAT